MRVAVVGAGIAGLAAALRLAQRGYQVTLYEETDVLGGNVSSQQVDGVYHDVYPHMFCDWYANFWEIFETDLGLDRSAHFEPRAGVRLLRKGEGLLRKGAPESLELKNATTFRTAWQNLRSGVLPLPDMFLLGYSMLDLASQPFDRSGLLSGLSVNGFLYSRPYASERCADLHDFILMEIWSIHGDLTSAAAYKKFIKHTLGLRGGVPFAWMLKGSLQEKLIGPLQRKLEALGCTIRVGAAVKTVRIEAGKAHIELPNGEQPQEDYVVLAVHPAALANLVMRGKRGQRIVDRIPALSELRRLRAECIPVVDVYFKMKLPGIPKEHVGLIWSDSDLSVLDISQLWTDDPNMRDRTALVLAASNFYAFPSETPAEDGYLMIHKLHEYFPVFEPGRYWGDPASDICWEKTHFRPNRENKLFINDVGSATCRPESSYPAVPNLFFAGDYCKTDVDMATIEAATLSGLQAAQALWRTQPLGAPITIAEYDQYGEAAFIAAKLALMPFAYSAKWWSIAFEAVPELSKGDLAGGLIAPAARMLMLPLRYTVDCWETAYGFWKSVLHDREWLDTEGWSRVMDRLAALWNAARADDEEDDVDEALSLVGHRRRWRVKR